MMLQEAFDDKPPLVVYQTGSGRGYSFLNTDGMPGCSLDELPADAGFVEYNSMYFGFRSLYFFALIMYALAFLGSIKARSN